MGIKYESILNKKCTIFLKYQSNYLIRKEVSNEMLILYNIFYDFYIQFLFCLLSILFWIVMFCINK